MKTQHIVSKVVVVLLKIAMSRVTNLNVSL